MVDLNRALEVGKDGLSFENGIAYLSGEGDPSLITVDRPCYYKRNNGETWFNKGTGNWFLISPKLNTAEYTQINYTGDVVSSVGYFSDPGLGTPSRIALHSLTYTGDNLTSESLVYYDSNGTTVLCTFTWAHTYSGNNLQNTSLVIT